MTERTDAQVRALVFELEGRANDDEIPVVVSTDAVVEVSDGPEILLHTPDAVDLRRAPLPIIATHRSNQINVGIVDGIRLSDGKMRGLAKFGVRQEAAEYRADVLNGTIRSVSVGYVRIKGNVRADGVLVTSRWMPTHAAMVAEPADVGAGFYRADITREEPTQVSQPAAPAASHERQATMAEPQAAAGAIAEDPTNKGAQQPAQPRQGPSAMDLEKARVRTIENLCEANKLDRTFRDSWVGEGLSIDSVADEILKVVKERAKSHRSEEPSRLGLSEQDAQRFSIFKAALAIHSGDWTKAGFERECSQAIAQRLGVHTPDPKKFYVPTEVQERQVAVTPGATLAAGAFRHTHLGIQQRDVTVGTPSAGGYLVGTSNVSYIEMLRNRSVAFRMGAQPLPGQRENITIPRQTATGSATWLANEASTLSEITQTFGQLAMSPKSVGAYTEISRQLALQSNPAIEGIVTSDLATVTALAVDTGVISGSGASGQPTGIVNTAGIGSVTGTSLAFDDILEFQTDVASANVMPARGGYATTHAVASLCIQRVKYSSTASPLWEGNVWDGQMQGFPAMASNQMGSATMLFGDWSQVLVPEWGVLEVEVNPYANFTAAIIGIRALYTMDCGLRYAGAFSYAGSIT